TPTVLAGYHHQWSPGNHTLLLAGRFDDRVESDYGPHGSSKGCVLGQNTKMPGVAAGGGLGESYDTRFEGYTAEAQQIATMGSHTLIAGTRLSLSEQHAHSRVFLPDGFDFNSFLLSTNVPVTDQHEHVQTTLAAIYAYDYFQLLDTLQLIGGLNY